MRCWGAIAGLTTGARRDAAARVLVLTLLALAVVTAASIGGTVAGGAVVAALVAPVAAWALARDREARRLAPAVAAAADRLHELDHRVTQRHPLTGLPTREPLQARIDGDRADGEGGLLGVIAFGDYERLAAFDTGLADRVLATLIGRVVDMTGDGPMIAQIDRARVALWYGPAIPPASARAELNALRYALGQTLREGGHELIPRVTLGLAEAPHDGVRAPALITRAVAALGALAAPAADDDPIEAARADYAIEQGLRRAIARDEFELAFQPLIDLAAGRVTGAEALLRWRHPELGLVSPARFVPIAEGAGLADEIGLWVMNAAAREAKGWERAGLPGLRVAVNVSGHQLSRPDMRALVERTLARHALAPERFEIELTETVATGDVASAAALFASLREIGVKIAIDDFGTGFSSLSSIRRLAFDKLKIDREFVTDVDRRRDSQAICRSLIALGQGLGIRVLAEGVERAEEVDWLRSAGCRHFQGFHFSRPLPSLDFLSFAREPVRRAASLPAERRTA